MNPNLAILRKEQRSLKELFSGPDLRRLAQLFIVMSGAWLTPNAAVRCPRDQYRPEVKSSGVNTGILIGAALSIPLYPLIGLISQKIGGGRRLRQSDFECGTGVRSVFYPRRWCLSRLDQSHLSGRADRSSHAPIWAVHTPYLIESFRTGIRSSGYGVSYSLATILPGLYSFYLLGLAKLMPYEFGPIVLLAMGGLLLSFGALAGPETKHVDLHRDVMVGTT